jgi:alpha-galactosidase
VKVDLKSLGFTSACTITDLWTGKLVGKFTGEFAPMVNRHGAGLYRIVKAN